MDHTRPFRTVRRHHRYVTSHEAFVLVVLMMQWSSAGRIVGDDIISTVLKRVMLIVSFITPAVALSPTLVTSKVWRCSAAAS